MFPPETQMLLCCGRAEMDHVQREHLRLLLAGPMDWERLLRLAKRHKLRPLLQRHLQDAPFAGVPLPIVQRLADFAQSNRYRNLALTAHLRALLRLLEDDEVKVLLLKGPATASRLYGDPSQREFRDLDVLIERRQVPWVHARLVGWGCRLTPPAVRSPHAGEELTFLRLAQENVYTYLLPDGKSRLELHWALIPPSLGLLIRFEEAWARRQTLSFSGVETSGLGDADLLVYLAAHGAKHRWQRLEWLSSWGELARQMKGADWEQAWAIARRAHVVRLMHLALALSSEVSDAPLVLPGPIAPDGFLPPELAGTVMTLWQKDEGMEQSVADSLFYSAARERFQDRLLCRARLALRPSFHDLGALPEPLRRFPLYLLLRPCRLLVRRLPQAFTRELI